MPKLYWCPRTRAIRPRWLLEELGLVYELVQVDEAMRASEEYRRIHPLGKVPALVDGEVSLFESAAICLYLADKHIDLGLAPPLGVDELRAPYDQWMVFGVATLEQAAMPVLMAGPEGPSAEAQQRLAAVFGVLDRAVEPGPFLLGEQFSAADVMLGSMAIWADAAGALEAYPHLQKYAQRLSQRDAYQRAAGPAVPVEPEAANDESCGDQGE